MRMKREEHYYSVYRANLRARYTSWVKIAELDFFDRTVRKVRNWNQKWVLIAGTLCISEWWKKICRPMASLWYFARIESPLWYLGYIRGENTTDPSYQISTHCGRNGVANTIICRWMCVCVYVCMPCRWTNLQNHQSQRLQGKAIRPLRQGHMHRHALCNELWEHGHSERKA